ncbi:MAG: hypothetical protein QOH87_5136 [Trebonia sp.]|nr:hypothetical protein [Trebonia sp.]
MTGVSRSDSWGPGASRRRALMRPRGTEKCIEASRGRKYALASMIAAGVREILINHGAG